ncbi:MAG: flippase-like domain-containing protein [Methanobacteriota archaeon]
MKMGLKFASSRSLLITMLIFLIVLAAAILILRENLSLMLQALYRANYLYVPLAVFAYLFGLLIWSLRWRVSLSTVGHHLSIKSAYVIIFGGIFINNITPFTYSGGDPIARAYILKKTQNVPYSRGFATILAEYVVDLPVYISLLIFGFLVSLKQMDIWYDVFMFLIWLAFIVGWSFFFRHVLSSTTGTKRIARFASRLAKVFHRRIKVSKIERSIKRFYLSSEKIIRNRRVIFYVTICTVSILTMAIIRLYIIFLALGYTPTIPMLFFAVTLPALVGMVPVLPGGLGTVDAAIASVFLLSGAPIEIAISATLIERAITLVFSTLIGAGAISYLGIKHGNTKRPRVKKPL